MGAGEGGRLSALGAGVAGRRPCGLAGGAPRRLGAWTGRSAARTAGLVAAAVLALLPPHAHAQDPPDSLQVPPDSLQDSTAVADSVPADSLVADSVEADSVPPPPMFPTLPDPAPAHGFNRIREWDRTELLAARGQTLWELLADIPGLLGIRSGDFGSAATVIPVGYSGGGLRLYYDGIEHLPLEGSVPDLTRIPLSGLERVRVIQRPGGVEVRLFRLAHSDTRPASLVEAGTGDEDTNMLRGTVSLPRMFGGKGALAIERLDTRGRDNPGAITGGWFRYSLHRGDQAGIRYEIRRMGTTRTVINDSPGSVNRNDWSLQGRLAPAEGLLAEGWVAGASVSTGDTTQVFPFSAESRRQYGMGLSGSRGPVWGRGTARWNRGEGVADRELAAEFSALAGRWGGVSGRTWRETWDEREGTGYDLRVWATPISYAAFFAERGHGSRSVPYLNPLPPEEPADTTGTMEDPDSVETDPGPASRFTTRTGTRVGARGMWREHELSVARLAVEADSVWPTQLLFDRGGVVLPQPLRRGWEVTGRIPLRPRGLFLEAEVQLWEKADSATLYFPDHLYRASFSFHRVFRATGNFEMWADLGVQGRSEMYVPQPDEEAVPMVDEEGEEILVPSTVPFYQNWYFRLQLRFLTLNIFATVENVSFRDNNQDVPGVLLPVTRGVYGVRWSFWN